MNAVRGRGVQRGEQFEDVAIESQVTHHEGTGQTQFAWRPEQSPHGVG